MKMQRNEIAILKAIVSLFLLSYPNRTTLTLSRCTKSSKMRSDSTLSLRFAKEVSCIKM